jgi:hypothetical protein
MRQKAAERRLLGNSMLFPPRGDEEWKGLGRSMVIE